MESINNTSILYVTYFDGSIPALGFQAYILVVPVLYTDLYQSTCSLGNIV